MNTTTAAAGKWMVLGDVLGSLHYMGQCPCGRQHMSTHARVFMVGHVRHCEACGYKLEAAAKADKPKLARIEYTTQRGAQAPVRRAKEVDAEKVDREIDKLVEKGAFNFDVKYEVTP